MAFELWKTVSSRTCLNSIDEGVIVFCDDISSAVLLIFKGILLASFFTVLGGEF